MLIEEILASVEAIRDPYIRAVTYARIGERLARKQKKQAKEAFLKAIDTAERIDDPVLMLKALLSLGYSMRRVNMKASGKIYRRVMESIRYLPKEAADEVLGTAVMYAISLSRIEEAIGYAISISNSELRDNALLAIVRKNTALIERERIKIAYRIRKSKLAVEYIKDESVRSKALLEIIRSYVLMGSYTNAINTMRDIKRKEWVKQAFKELVIKLSSKGVIEEYAGMLVKTAQEFIKKFDSDFRMELAIAFSIAGEGKKAAELVRMGRGDTEGDMIKVAERLFKVDRSALLRFMRGLRLEESKTVGKVILNMILENPEFADSTFVVSVARLSRSEEVWVKTARYLAERGEVDEAWRIAKSLSSDRLRSMVLANVAHRLVRRGNINRAIDAALEVRDPQVSSVLVAEILVGAVDTIKERVRDHG